MNQAFYLNKALTRLKVYFFPCVIHLEYLMSCSWYMNYSSYSIHALQQTQPLSLR